MKFRNDLGTFRRNRNVEYTYMRKPVELLGDFRYLRKICSILSRLIGFTKKTLIRTVIGKIVRCAG